MLISQVLVFQIYGGIIMDTRISGKTRLLGVFGTPIKHSGSPIMYNFCFDYYGIDCAYLAFDTDASQVKDSLAAMLA